MIIRLISRPPTQPGHYILRIANGGPHMVLVQKELDGALTVHFDHPNPKINGKRVDDHLFSQASWSEYLEVER